MALGRHLFGLLIILLAVPLVAAAWGGWVHYSDNFHTVQAGAFYRSGQLDTAAFKQMIARYKIRTVINLRGAHPGADWYDAEVAAARQADIAYHDLKLSAKRVPSFTTIEHLEMLFKTAPQPILVHCEGGADRSGLVSALYEAFVRAKPVNEATRQLSYYYGHFPWLWSRSGAMDEALALYAGLGSKAVAAR